MTPVNEGVESPANECDAKAILPELRSVKKQFPINVEINVTMKQANHVNMQFYHGAIVRISSLMIVLPVLALMTGCKSAEIKQSNAPAAQVEGGSREANFEIFMGVVKNDPKAVIEGLDRGGDPNFNNRDPKFNPQGDATVLMLAASAGEKEIVEMLLARGADPKLTHDNKTALDYARERGHKEIVKILENAK